MPEAAFNPTRLNDLFGLAALIIQSILALVGSLAFLAILYAGFQYLTAAGNESQVGQAKRTLLYTLVGLILAAGALGLVTFLRAWLFQP